MPRPAIRSPRASAEAGFSIIEVLIAALLLAVVVAGATAVLGGSSRSLATNKVRDRETALASQMLAKLQADPSWSTVCQNSLRTSANATCDLAPWLARSYPKLGVVTEGGETLRFNVGATATGFDLEADGTGPDDKDGLRPDIYRVVVSVKPDGNLANRFPSLRPTTVRAELNPSIRMQSGRVTVDVCHVINQADERMPIAGCSGGSTQVKMLPPGPLDMTSASTINSTCDGPESSSKGSDERDCIAYKCGDPNIAGSTGRGNVGCPADSPPSQWTPQERTYTSVTMRPGSGSVTLRSTRTGATFGPMPLSNGRAEFLALPVGEFEVTTSLAGNDVPWKSKSVPSTGLVAVEAGLNSRAVLLFRPPATGSVTIDVSSVDSTTPWEPVLYDGWVSMKPDGTLVDGNSTQRLCLVPAPQGRLVPEEVKCIDVARSSSTIRFEFTDVEPGLYTAYIGDPDYLNFKSLGGTDGFIWVPRGGSADATRGPAAPIEYVQGMCATDIRKAMVAAGTVNPDTGSALETCSSPGGSSPVGGGGGGGSQ